MVKATDVVGVIAFFVLLIIAGIGFFYLLVKFFPILIALVLVAIALIAIAGILIFVFGFFAAAFGAIYWALTKKPEEVPSPMKLEEAKEPKKKEEEGT